MSIYMAAMIDANATFWKDCMLQEITIKDYCVIRMPRFEELEVSAFTSTRMKALNLPTFTCAAPGECKFWLEPGSFGS
ncbi:MAG: hypothetical protein USCGTAYLOR_00526 [Chromatiales bacterium USCg_Taylor]|nr:MAG: hypothetical protein USCGTAYLOR_00526 [Chromatiales bacterium USCg_Taylor]